MKIFNENSPTQSSQYIQHEWLHKNTDRIDNDTYCEYMDEYICI